MIRFFNMRRIAAPLAAVLMPLGAIALANPALAQTPVPVPAQTNNASDAAYSDLYAAMQEGLDSKQIIESSLAALGREFAANPDFASAEAVSPGLIAEVIEGLRPILNSQSERITVLYRPSTLGLFARHLTPDEAHSIAAFYRSDLGRKLMGGLSQSYSPDNTLSTIQTDTPVTRDQVQADISAATSKVMGQMSSDDLAEMGRMALANPALFKLEKVSSGVQVLRTQMENEPLTAEEDAAVLAVVEDVFARRLGGD